MVDQLTEFWIQLGVGIVGSGLGTTVVGLLFKRKFDRELELHKAFLSRAANVHGRMVDALATLYRHFWEVQVYVQALSHCHVGFALADIVDLECGDLHRTAGLRNAVWNGYRPCRRCHSGSDGNRTEPLMDVPSPPRLMVMAVTSLHILTPRTIPSRSKRRGSINPSVPVSHWWSIRSLDSTFS